MDKCDAIGEPAVKPLIRELNDADMMFRSNAAGALGRIGEPPLSRYTGVNDADSDVSQQRCGPSQDRRTGR